MTPHERFVHFVVLFLGDYCAGMGGRDIVKEALSLRIQFEGSPVQPMEAAWAFVDYRRTGANRPSWLPTSINNLRATGTSSPGPDPRPR
jgi:hypothetical protein